MLKGTPGSNGRGRFLERLAKKTAGFLLAKISSPRHRNWHGVEAAGPIKKIIVIRQHNQFGDVLCTVPLLRSLQSKYAPDELTVVVSPQNIDALAGSRYANTLLNYDKLSFYRKPSLFLEFVRNLRRGYDLLLVPSNVSISLTNDLIAFFVKAKTKIGPRSLESKPNETSSVYDIAVDLRWEEKIAHQSFRNMKVAEPLGISRDDDSGELEYQVDAATSAEVAAFIARVSGKSGRRVALHAGAGKVPNRWNVVNFARLSELLHDELGAEVFLTEGPMDHDVIEHLINLVKVPFVRVRNKTVSFIAALLKEMDLVVTNDTGVMHLSAAVGTPTLSLFGPTDPLQWAPLGKRHRFILGKSGDINTIDVNKTFGMVKKVLQRN
ncbi:MAG: glycosyltransferase family 9 protein [Bacteroidetes bacterium]|nr:glycosyltransferase family 9 protein [Bacteroidota bacterium]